MGGAGVSSKLEATAITAVTATGSRKKKVKEGQSKQTCICSSIRMIDKHHLMSM